MLHTFKSSNHYILKLILLYIQYLSEFYNKITSEIIAYREGKYFNFCDINYNAENNYRNRGKTTFMHFKKSIPFISSDIRNPVAPILNCKVTSMNNMVKKTQEKSQTSNYIL